MKVMKGLLDERSGSLNVGEIVAGGAGPTKLDGWRGRDG